MIEQFDTVMKKNSDFSNGFSWLEIDMIDV